jgi:hypothetical protein
MLFRRLLRSVLALACVLALAGLGLYGQEKKGDDKKDDKKGDKPAATKETPKGQAVTLKWKFDKGKSFYQTMVTETDQTMKVNNNNVKQTQKQTFYFSWKVDDVAGDNVTLTQKILGVIMDIDIAGSKISYNSTEATAPAQNPLSEFFKQLVGSEFKVTLNTKDYTVTKIEGREKFLEKLIQANQQMKPLLETILSDKALKEMAEPTFAAMPGKPVAEGDSWTRETTLDMGPIGTYKNVYKYTYRGKDEKTKLDKIEVETTLTYVAPKEQASGVGGLPFKIKDANLKSGESKGMIYFDEAKGRVDHSDLSLDLKGELQIEIGGQTTKVDLEQKQKTTVTASDTDPLQKK